MEPAIVTVFGASGRQGQAQVRALLGSGYAVRAISRHPGIFTGTDLAAAIVIAADYADPQSIDAAVTGADAVFFQPPQAEVPANILAFAQTVAEAATKAGVHRFILNSTMWVPDEPCGQPMYDLAHEIETIIAAASVPLTIFRPTVFMDNWLTAFAKPALVNEHVYRYPHKPDLRYSPISLDDLAKFMVAALARDDLAGRRIRVAGPETLTPPDVAAILSEAMGVPITFDYIAPVDFGHYVHSLMGEGTGMSRDDYAAYFDSFYRFNNDAPQEPFRFDVAPVLVELPVVLEPFRKWAKRQDWTSLDDGVGSSTR